MLPGVTPTLDVLINSRSLAKPLVRFTSSGFVLEKQPDHQLSSTILNGAAHTSQVQATQSLFAPRSRLLRMTLSITCPGVQHPMVE